MQFIVRFFWSKSSSVIEPQTATFVWHCSNARLKYSFADKYVLSLCFHVPWGLQAMRCRWTSPRNSWHSDGGKSEGKPLSRLNHTSRHSSSTAVIYLLWWYARQSDWERDSHLYGWESATTFLFPCAMFWGYRYAESCHPLCRCRSSLPPIWWKDMEDVSHKAIFICLRHFMLAIYKKIHGNAHKQRISVDFIIGMFYKLTY